MSVFRYLKQFNVNDQDEVIIKIELPDVGSASHHLIDIPGNMDLSGLNSCSIQLGKGLKLKTERTLVFSKPFNIDPNNEQININYYINDVLLQSHSNLKSVDLSPQIVLTIQFI
ncbi:MAG: hypothetical protein V4620_09555 [Bacteroidota bacterium]